MIILAGRYYWSERSTGVTDFSKKALDRHPYPREVLKLFQDFVGHEVPTYR
jgi:hypothetical protein